MNISNKEKANRNKEWLIKYLKIKFQQGNKISGTISGINLTLHYNDKSLWCNLESNMKYFKNAILDITR